MNSTHKGNVVNMRWWDALINTGEHNKLSNVEGDLNDQLQRCDPGEHYTSSVWVEVGKPCVGRVMILWNTSMKNPREPRKTLYLLHVERVCVFCAKLDQLGWGPGGRTFLWGWGQVLLLHQCFLLCSLIGWLQVSWLWLILSVGCWSSAAVLSRADGRWDVKAHLDQNSLPIHFYEEGGETKLHFCSRSDAPAELCRV